MKSSVVVERCTSPEGLEDVALHAGWDNTNFDLADFQNDIYMKVIEEGNIVGFVIFTRFREGIFECHVAKSQINAKNFKKACQVVLEKIASYDFVTGVVGFIKATNRQARYFAARLGAKQVGSIFDYIMYKVEVR